MSLDIRDLVVEFGDAAGPIRAVDGVSLTVEAGQWVGLVGESGSGKSTLAHAVLRLLPPGARVRGRVELDGQNLLELSTEEMRRLRGSTVALVLQAALDSLDPLYSVGWQVREAIDVHRRGSHQREVERLLHEVDLDSRLLGAYPHQLSGGMRQRVVIAMAIALAPRLLLLDEPTTALDVITQDEILARLRSMPGNEQRAVVFISHDVAVVAENCDRIAVMYNGRVVEYGPTQAILSAALNPYTFGLIESSPDLTDDRARLVGIPGTMARGTAGAACVFAPRCGLASDPCRTVRPELRESGPGHYVACHAAETMGERSTRDTLLAAWGSVR